MKKFKLIDFWISVMLIVIFTTVCLTDRPGFPGTLLWGYGVVGAWQVISMLVHTMTGYFTRKWGARFIYHWLCVIAVITMPAGSVWILAFTAPSMAVYYTWMCYREVFVKMKRPMDLLK